MKAFTHTLILLFGTAILQSGCNSTPKTTDTANAVANSQPVNPSEYMEFSQKFQVHNMPYTLPDDVNDSKAPELDKKFIKDMLAMDLTPAFGKEYEVPGLIENIEDGQTKYFASAKIKLDSFDGYIIHKQEDDDYYFLCIFDKQGRFTDGTCIAFTEGDEDSGTLRKASIDDAADIKISQFDIEKGKPNMSSGSERHFYEITVKGKIRDLKENTTPGNA